MNRISERPASGTLGARAAPGALRAVTALAALLGLTALLFLNAGCSAKPKTPWPTIATVPPLPTLPRDLTPAPPTVRPTQTLPVATTAPVETATRDATPLPAQAAVPTETPPPAGAAAPTATSLPAQAAAPTATLLPAGVTVPTATLPPVPAAAPTTAPLPVRTAPPTATPLPATPFAPPATPLPDDDVVLPSPTPLPCGETSLALGAMRFRVRSLSPARDGTIVVPANMPGIAYWVQGTGFHYLFALSPTEENLRLQEAVRAGDPAVITWASCSTDAYQVQAVEASVPAHAELLRRSTDGLTVFAQAGAGGQGVLVRAGR